MKFSIRTFWLLGSLLSTGLLLIWVAVASFFAWQSWLWGGILGYLLGGSLTAYAFHSIVRDQIRHQGEAALKIFFKFMAAKILILLAGVVLFALVPSAFHCLSYAFGFVLGFFVFMSLAAVLYCTAQRGDTHVKQLA